MSRQTRIDQFYKTLIHRSASHNEKRGKLSEASKSPKNTTKQDSTTKLRFARLSRLKRDQSYSRPGLRNDTQKAFDKTEHDTEEPLDESFISMDSEREKTANSSFSDKSQSYVPKVSHSPKDRLQRLLTRQRITIIDQHLLRNAIEQLNLSIEGAIPKNNFNLQEIYTENSSYIYEYSCVDTTASVKYELKDIKVPKSDIYSELLFIIIITVFSNPVNCGYFEKDELDFVYSILTLPEQALMLFVRMLKRQRSWFRKSSLTYPEIEEDVDDLLDILASHSICMFELSCEEELKKLLGLMQVDEIRYLCRSLKINATGTKDKCIQRLEEFAKSKPLFSKVPTQIQRLRSQVFTLIGRCVALTDRTWCIIDRIMTLLIPGQYPETSISDMFFLLMNIHKEKRTFPNFPIQHIPIFSSRQDLIKYMEAADALNKVLNHIEKKDWAAVRKLGQVAKYRVLLLLPNESECLRNSTLPKHVKRFMPGYTWLKVLSKSVAAYRKSSESEAEAVQILELLICQNCHMQNRKGEWYNELALIQMHKLKDLNACADTIVEAMNVEHTSVVDRVNLFERGMRILKKKTGVVKADKKEKISKLLDIWRSTVPCLQSFSPASIKIEASSLVGNSGYKRKWCIDTGTEDKSYGSVEMLAMYHYEAQGYPNGLHCEGSLPVALFSVLFWEELYTVSVPGAYPSAFQTAPQDLFTDQFYTNRKELIEKKFETCSQLDLDSFSTLMQNQLNKYRDYESIIPSNLFEKDRPQFKDIICCLGVHAVLGICKQVLHNFTVWRSGFPDLIVWNSETRKYKIVEVKGPADVLSAKQKLWLNYLQELGVFAEVCYVRSKGHARIASGK